MTRKQAFEASIRKIGEQHQNTDGIDLVLVLMRSIHDAALGGCAWRDIEEVLRRVDTEEASCGR